MQLCVQPIIVERLFILKLVIHADSGILTDEMEVSEVECPDILSGYNVAVELIVTPIDLILTGKTDAIKQGAASGMGAGAEGGGKFRFQT